MFLPPTKNAFATLGTMPGWDNMVHNCEGKPFGRWLSVQEKNREFPPGFLVSSYALALAFALVAFAVSASGSA